MGLQQVTGKEQAFPGSMLVAWPSRTAGQVRLSTHECPPCGVYPAATGASAPLRGTLTGMCSQGYLDREPARLQIPRLSNQCAV